MTSLAVLISLSGWDGQEYNSAIMRLVDDQQAMALRAMRRAMVFLKRLMLSSQFRATVKMCNRGVAPGS